MSDEKQPVVIKPEIIELAEKLKADILVNKDGTASVDGEFYQKHLPEGVTPEQIDFLRSMKKHDAKLMAAVGLAFGEKTIKVMEKNSDIQQVVLEVPTIDKDSFDFSFLRSRQVPDRTEGSEGTVTKYGSLSIKVNTYGAGDRGQVAKVRRHLSDKATSAFGG